MDCSFGRTGNLGACELLRISTELDRTRNGLIEQLLTGITVGSQSLVLAYIIFHISNSNLHIFFVAMQVFQHFRCLLMFLLFFQSLGMFTKRALPDAGEGAEASKRFRGNVADLFLSNDISGCRTQSLFQDGADCGIQDFVRLAKAGNSGKSKNHIQRDLLRKLRKGSQWPDLYEAPVRVWNTKTQAVETVNLPMLLPHELLYALSGRANIEVLSSREGMCQATAEHVRKVSELMGCENLVGVSLWGDGVPCNWDKSQTLDVFAFGLPGLPARYKNLRIPLAAINKDHCTAGRESVDDILAILAWSFQCMAQGAMPETRHDGAAFGKGDAKRARWARNEAPKGILAEVRADWAFYKKAFRFPQHNENAGNCWKCKVIPSTFRDVGASAPWRTNRLDHYGFLSRLHASGLSPSPLFGAPYLTTTCFLLDWLHVMDLGVSADWLGNVFKLVSKKLPGASDVLRVRDLFLHMQKYWNDFDIQSRLLNLTPSMLQQPRKKPKLRGGAAVVRHLVPFGLQMANRFLDPTDPFEESVQHATFHLSAMYEQLSPDVYDQAVLAEHSRKFALLAVACEASSPYDKMFAVKPKLHLMQELCEFDTSCPSLHWCYRDEDFGGGTMQTGKRRGGQLKPRSTGFVVLHKFTTKNKLPWLQ